MRLCRQILQHTADIEYLNTFVCVRMVLSELYRRVKCETKAVNKVTATDCVVENRFSCDCIIKDRVSKRTYSHVWALLHAILGEFSRSAVRLAAH